MIAGGLAVTRGAGVRYCSVSPARFAGSSFTCASGLPTLLLA